MKIIIIVAVVIILLIAMLFLIPIINNKYWNSLTEEQQCLGLTQKAKKLLEFKNLSGGTQGKLYYIVNKRKVLIYPWVLKDNEMIIIKKNPFDKWNYPDRELTSEEIEKAKLDLDEYNQRSKIKFKYAK